MDVTAVLIRNAVPSDLVALVALERETAEAPHWAEIEYSAIVNVDREVDALVRRCLLIAEGESGLLGFAVGKAIGTGKDTVGELESVVVKETARRAGVGKALCEAIVAWSRQQGAQALELEVRAGSKGVIALYSGLGFVVTGRRLAYYQWQVDADVLTRLRLETRK